MSQVADHARWTTPGAFGRHPLPRKGAEGETIGGGGGIIGNVDKTLLCPLLVEGRMVDWFRFRNYYTMKYIEVIL